MSTKIIIGQLLKVTKKKTIQSILQVDGLYSYNQSPTSWFGYWQYMFYNTRTFQNQHQQHQTEVVFIKVTLQISLSTLPIILIYVMKLLYCIYYMCHHTMYIY